MPVKELLNGTGFADQAIDATVLYPYTEAITDRNFVMCLPLGSIYTATDPDPSAPGGEELFNNRSAGFIVEIGATGFTIKKEAGSSNATGALARCFAQKWDAADLAGTDSQVHLVADVEFAFGNTDSVGTRSVLNAGLAVTDADKVAYIPRGGYCTSGTSGNRHDNYLMFLPQIDAAGAASVNRGHGAFAADIEGSTWQFGPDWRVHRASIINPTWTATGDGVSSYVDVNMHENRTASGAVSNPNWDEQFYKQCFKLWPTASTDKRRPHNVLGFNIDPAPDGRARVTVPNEAVATWPANATIWIEVITHPALRSTTQSRYFGNVWNTDGVVHNTGTVPWGIDDTSFHNIDPSQIMQTIQNINEDAAPTGTPVRGWQGGVIDPEQMLVQLFWNSATDQFLLTSTLTDFTGLDASTGLAQISAEIDAYDGTISITSQPMPGAIDDIQLQGTDGVWVSVPLTGTPTTTEAQGDLTDEYAEGGLYEFIPMGRAVPVRVLSGADLSREESVEIPVPVGQTLHPVTVGSTDLTANGATDALLSALNAATGRVSVPGDDLLTGAPVNEFSVPGGAILGSWPVRAFNDVDGWTTVETCVFSLSSFQTEKTRLQVTILPPVGRDYVDLGALSPMALAGMVAGEQIDYPSANLTINPDGTYLYTGAAPATITIERTDRSGTWTAFDIDVWPELDLASPNWTPPASYQIALPAQVDANDIFNESLDDPNALVEIIGFPGTSSVSGDIATIDTSAAGTFPVEVRATINGIDYVSYFFDIVISANGIAVDPIQHTQTVDEVASLTLGFSVPVEPIAQTHRLDALGILSQLVVTDSVAQGHRVDDLALLFDLPVESVEQGQFVEQVGPLQGLSLSVDDLMHIQKVNEINAVGISIVLDAMIRHGSQLDDIASVLEQTLPGFEAISQAQMLDDVDQPLGISVTLIDRVAQSHTLEDAAAVPNTPLMITGGITHQHSVDELVNVLQSNSVLSVDDLIHAQLVGGALSLALSNTPLIPADGIVVIRSKTIQ